MANVNRVIMVGRLMSDPKVATTEDGREAALFSLVVTNKELMPDGRWREEDMHLSCEAYDRPGGKQMAQVACKLGKGQQHYMEGRLRTKKWRDERGRTRNLNVMVVDTIEYLTRKSDAAGEEGATPFHRSRYSAMTAEDD